MTKRNPPKRILLVEGNDDKYFVESFCNEILNPKLICKIIDESNSKYNDHNDKTVFYVDGGKRKTSGLDNMIKRAMEELIVEGRKVVGIIADANGQDFDNPEHPWQKIKSKLEEVLNLEDVNLPERPCKTGLILPNITPKENPKSTLHVGVWLMPDNESSGELENFFAGLISESNPTWTLAKEYISQYMESMEQTEARQGGFDMEKSYKVSKAEVYAWLAIRKKPGKMGAAISQGYGLNFESELAQNFARWLEELFCF